MRGRRFRKILMLLAAVVLATAPWASDAAIAAVPGANDLVSTTSTGVIGNDGSWQSSMSSDGRYVAFASSASNLVAGDTNGVVDIFVKDRTSGSVTRASVDSSGGQANDSSGSVQISSDGRYVVFDSWASNLVSGDTNNSTDIFRHDTRTGATTLISQSSGGSIGNGPSNNAYSSSDGRYVVFESAATNLVSGDTNAFRDIFVHDEKLNTTKRLNMAGGAEANNSSFNATISGDGRYIAYSSRASNLTPSSSGYNDIMLLDRVDDNTLDITASANAASNSPDISSDGSSVAFQSNASNLVGGDTNAKGDIFLYNVGTANIARVSVDSSGNQSNSDSTDTPAISGDGRYIAYVSVATNLVVGDSNGYRDAFLYDTQAASTQLLSVASGGAQGNNDTNAISMSADGQNVSMMTLASNIVTGDTNANWDDIAAQTGNNAVVYCRH